MTSETSDLPDHSERERQAALKTLTTVVYVLYGLSYFVGISAFVAVVINYVKRVDVRGTWLESHFRWQIRTFWFSVLWMAVGAITFFILIGWAVLGATALWGLYRVVKGWLYLNDGRPMYA